MADEEYDGRDAGDIEAERIWEEERLAKEAAQKPIQAGPPKGLDTEVVAAIRLDEESGGAYREAKCPLCGRANKFYDRGESKELCRHFKDMHWRDSDGQMIVQFKKEEA